MFSFHPIVEHNGLKDLSRNIKTQGKVIFIQNDWPIGKVFTITLQPLSLVYPQTNYVIGGRSDLR